MSCVSISIVLYQTPLEMLAKCLQHYDVAVRHLALPVQLLLVNNSHTVDGASLQQWVSDQRDYAFDLRYVAAPKNGGYGYGHNLAIQQSQANYHLVSNADIYVEAEALLHAYTYMENHPQVGLLSPDVYDLQQQRCYLCKKDPSFTTAFLRRLPAACLNGFFKRLLADFENRHLDYDQVITDYRFPTGCFMFLRRTVLDAVKGFDEGYFMYCEDADIGRRIKAIAQLAYVPSVRCTHAWQRASKHSWKLLWVHVCSLLRYRWKFRGKITC